jgi:hypothetical protein
MQDPLDAFRDQVFYREAVRLRDEQRSRMELRNQSSNVVSFEQYRREQQQRVQSPTTSRQSRRRDGRQS